MVVFTYLFAVKTFWHHAVMVVMLSGLITFAIFLIYALNGPFAGDVKVQPTRFITTIQNMEHVDGRPARRCDAASYPGVSSSRNCLTNCS